MNLEEFKNNINIIIDDVREFAVSCPIECIILDTDISYLKSFDRLINILNEIYKNNNISINQVNDISFNLGVFLGEMIIRENKYHWIINNNGVPVIETNKNNVISPINYIYRTITNKNKNDEDNPSKLYNDLLKLDSE